MISSNNFDGAHDSSLALNSDMVVKVSSFQGLLHP